MPLRHRCQQLLSRNQAMQETYGNLQVYSHVKGNMCEGKPRFWHLTRTKPQHFSSLQAESEAITLKTFVIVCHQNLGKHIIDLLLLSIIQFELLNFIENCFSNNFINHNQEITVQQVQEVRDDTILVSIISNNCKLYFCNTRMESLKHTRHLSNGITKTKVHLLEAGITSSACS